MSKIVSPDNTGLNTSITLNWLTGANTAASLREDTSMQAFNDQVVNSSTKDPQ